MAGRFGKYGEIKRRARIRRQRLLKARFEKSKHSSHPIKKDERFMPQSVGKLQVIIDVRSKKE